MGVDITIATTLNMKHFKVGLHAISKIRVTLNRQALIKPVFSCQHWTGNESYFL